MNTDSEEFGKLVEFTSRVSTILPSYPCPSVSIRGFSFFDCRIQVDGSNFREASFWSFDTWTSQKGVTEENADSDQFLHVTIAGPEFDSRAFSRVLQDGAIKALRCCRRICDSQGPIQTRQRGQRAPNLEV